MTENSMHQARATLSAQSSVRKMTLTGVCVALLAASAYISFPLPFTPAMVTALTIMVNFVAFVMTPKEAGLTLLIYLYWELSEFLSLLAGRAGLPRSLDQRAVSILDFWWRLW